MELPYALCSAFKSLETSQQDKWKQKAAKEIKSPMMRLHLASLLLDGGDDDMHTAVELLCGFSVKGMECFAAFESVFCLDLLRVGLF